MIIALCPACQDVMGHTEDFIHAAEVSCRRCGEQTFRRVRL